MLSKELENIIQEGESYKIEFKESVDKTFVEEICAFANASGGRLFIGISDNGEVIGTRVIQLAHESKIQLDKFNPRFTVTWRFLEIL